MSHYWKKCPYCGHITEEGYGIPSKRLGDPQRRCIYCHKIYNDSSVIDWETASILKKILFYLGNGRLLCTIFVTILLEGFLRNWTNLNHWASTTITIVAFISILALCFFYVKLKVKLHYEGFFPYPIDEETTQKKNEEAEEKCQMATSNKNYIGTCTMCGKRNTMLTIVDEVEHVCEECLDNEYIFCDECKEYWLWDAIKFYHLNDGRTLCEHCAEDVDWDDIYFIENHTGIEDDKD